MDFFDLYWGIKGVLDIMVEIVFLIFYKCDYLFKKELYVVYGIFEYWIVDFFYYFVEVFVFQDGWYECYVFGIDGEMVGLYVLFGFELIVFLIFIDFIIID